MAQSESVIQTRQQHCSSQQGTIFRIKIANAIAFVCSAGETPQRAELSRVLSEN